MDNYKIEEVKLFIGCGVIYTAVYGEI